MVKRLFSEEPCSYTPGGVPKSGPGGALQRRQQERLDHDRARDAIGCRIAAVLLAIWWGMIFGGCQSTPHPYASIAERCAYYDAPPELFEQVDAQLPEDADRDDLCTQVVHLERRGLYQAEDGKLKPIEEAGSPAPDERTRATERDAPPQVEEVEFTPPESEPVRVPLPTD